MTLSTTGRDIIAARVADHRTTLGALVEQRRTLEQQLDGVNRQVQDVGALVDDLSRDLGQLPDGSPLDADAPSADPEAQAAGMMSDPYDAASAYLAERAAAHEAAGLAPDEAYAIASREAEGMLQDGAA